MAAWRNILARVGLATGVTCTVMICAACGSSRHSGSGSNASEQSAHASNIFSRVATSARSVARSQARTITALPAARRQGLLGWQPAVAVGGQPAVWISRVKAFREPGFSVTLLRFDQRLVMLALHAGGSQPGGAGWRYGAAIGRAERRTVVAGFNSGFEESYGAGGFEQDGRVGWALRRGAASVVIYRSGLADVGRWRQSVPAAGQRVAEVRQNLGLLIDGRRIAPNVDSCIKACWGDPLHERPVVARSALGITAGGDLVWAAGHDLSVRALAVALVGAGVVRAMELDINPEWVAGYLYQHSRRRPSPMPIPLMPGQTGIPGQFLAPYYRDFFTIITRSH